MDWPRAMTPNPILRFKRQPQILKVRPAGKEEGRNGPSGLSFANVGTPWGETADLPHLPLQKLMQGWVEPGPSGGTCFEFIGESLCQQTDRDKLINVVRLREKQTRE